MVVLEQYRAWLIAGAAVVLLAVGVSIGWSLNGWRLSGQVADAKTETANERTAHRADLATISNAAAQQVRESLAKQQAAQQKVADLDRKHTEELTNANAENNRLRARLATGGRVRVAGNCPANPVSVPAAAGPASVDHAGTVELSPEAGRNVLDVRAGIIADQAALRALQQYVREVCLAR
ncbi:MAG: lysis protein [Pseudomonas oryzihabitans]|uniref:lysis protein n=1 Tax=Pseudomonas oryzihabitans TaxID=47885 RepID=UPI00290C0E85|nr:lysis protein [Pseudomonas oryzihabitans]MDU4059443.1 lysis protein [Pseudomonas oryzihabitans]